VRNGTDGTWVGFGKPTPKAVHFGAQLRVDNSSLIRRRGVLWEPQERMFVRDLKRPAFAESPIEAANRSDRICVFEGDMKVTRAALMSL